LCTITTLENLLGVKSFDNTMGHLAHCQVILHAFSRGLGLPLVLQLTTFAFLGCWVLIIPTLVICFQQDDHLIILDVMTHVEIDNFPFYLTFWKSCGIVVFSLISFLDELLTQVRVCHIFNRCSFEPTWTCFWSYAGPIVGAWLLACPTILAFYLFTIHLITTLRTHFGLSHPTITYLSHCFYGYTLMV